MTYNGKEYVKQLISTIDKKKSESFKKAKEYLESIKFYEKKSDEIKEFLVSEEGLILLEGMSTDKLTILSISDCLRISQKEFHKLMRENAEIYDAIDRGSKADLDEANKALLMLVTGYYKTETKDIIYKNERGGKQHKRINGNGFHLNLMQIPTIITTNEMEYQENNRT